jgi:two-component system chemotaxis response regulator CheY
MARTLLITDDARVIREMIKGTVASAGWEIVGEAANGQEAIDRYAELKPAACTLDLVMPDYDGIHALKAILAMDKNAKVVVVSALEQSKILREAFKLGAADFLVKPFNPQALLDTLEHLVPSLA